jgi:glutathione S-transferase
MVAALNSVEPPILTLHFVNFAEPPGTSDPIAAMRATIQGRIGERLDQVVTFLGGREHLVGNRFSAADLLMTTVLRQLRMTDLVSARPALDAYRVRHEARPAFKKALAAQMETFEKHTPAS